MHIVGGMTVATDRRRIAVRIVRRMAVGTGRCEMGRRQWEVAEVVVEGPRIVGHDVGVATLVVRMAGDALRPLRRRMQAVEAETLLPVSAYVFVAGDA